jgi:D-alanyl-lipoteichoic acid acyltransferase DltB (MBOAT superfamily)
MTDPVARPGLTLAKYVRRRNGVPLGAPGGLRAMFARSLGASSFAGFWRYWNPIFGYLLGRYVFVPLKRVLPSSLSLVLTFVVCGALHDLVTSVVRGSPAFLFTPWFLFLGIGVLLGSALRMDTSSRSWSVRAGVNFAYLALCLVPALALQGALG